MAGGFRVSIPNNVKKTIQHIKEIAGNHTDDEIYAMLKECSMNPDETVDKLLNQDPFHEVKRKRDRRKESVNTREPTDSRWRSNMQGRGGGRGGRGGYSSRYVSHGMDAGGGRNIYSGKENGVNIERGNTSTSPVSQDTENKATIPISSHVTGMANGLTNAAHGSSTHEHGSQVSGSSGIPTPEESSAVGDSKTGSAPPPAADLKSTPATVTGGPLGQPAPSSDQFLATMIPASVSGVYSSASDPVLVPSLDTRVPGVVGTIKREVGSQRTVVELTSTVTALSKSVSHDVADSEQLSALNEKAASESRIPFMHGKISSKSQGVEGNQLVEASQAVSSASHAGFSSSRPSSNYGNRSQQVIGPQKGVGPSKEWKPKPTNPNIVQSSTEVAPVTVEVSAQSLSASSAADLEVTAKLQKKLEDLHFSDRQHVIIPIHLHVPEAERSGLSFGSFDASFGLNASFANGPDTDKSPTPLSESSQVIEESVEEPSSSNQNASSTAQEGDYSDNPQSPPHMPENLTSSEADASAGIPPMPEYDQSKPETVLPPGGTQSSVVHTNPSYSTFGVVPPMLGSQFPPFESSEPQARDASRVPSFVQPFDPSASYYTQFYRPGGDGDGRFSPFLSPGAATKYNGNITVLSSQTGQSPQESGNSLVLSTAGPTPLVTQAAGVMQSTIPVTQQPVPVFRQPAGVHISHYPPNYIPYSQYFSPFYVQPPTIHHFLNNAAFPQQTSNIYPSLAAAAAAAPTAVKYSLSQYKPGTNGGNSPHIGMPAGYGPYSSNPSGYSPSPASTTGNSAGNEDLATSQYKENNVYMIGQQSEGSAVWIPAPGRDISSLQASSFYNLPPQGQHMAYAPTQAGHGAFAGIYHPAQTVAAATVHPLLQQPQTMAGAVEMVGQPAGVYQQPQRAQIGWANNY
ncbi:GBF-interacting protein 1-like isoform X3 [Magnolia sinica]|uniref:GBF-interacting protein 1-like isoform X3 n=1 Tax=Magnolia sinica TaxID=86752 RepID=UPI002657CCD6|nr:GBF-interacting protein 1-like isoform X3 [Magnolia sinica]